MMVWECGTVLHSHRYKRNMNLACRDAHLQNGSTWAVLKLCGQTAFEHAKIPGIRVQLTMFLQHVVPYRRKKFVIHWDPQWALHANFICAVNHPSIYTYKFNKS